MCALNGQRPMLTQEAPRGTADGPGRAARQAPGDARPPADADAAAAGSTGATQLTLYAHFTLHTPRIARSLQLYLLSNRTSSSTALIHILVFSINSFFLASNPSTNQRKA